MREEAIGDCMKDSLSKTLRTRRFRRMRVVRAIGVGEVIFQRPRVQPHKAAVDARATFQIPHAACVIHTVLQSGIEWCASASAKEARRCRPSPDLASRTIVFLHV